MPDGWSWFRDEYEKETLPILGPKDFRPAFQTPNHPRVGVSWFESIAFCRWLTEQLQARGQLAKGDAITLPEEAQWEWAARWNKQTGVADDRVFPWGGKDEKSLAQQCNWDKIGIGQTCAVGLFPNGEADCGAMDLAGNVWEWCENWYDATEKKYRVLRGGSWVYDHPRNLSCSYRNDDDLEAGDW
jgi:formylglycine-generating enzyme required for sulfatase activity